MGPGQPRGHALLSTAVLLGARPARFYPGQTRLSSLIQLARRHPRDHRTVSHSPGSWAKLALRHPPDTRTAQPFIWTVGEAYPSTPTGYPDRPAITLIVGDIPGARSEPPSLGRCSLRVQVSSFFPLQ